MKIGPFNVICTPLTSFESWGLHLGQPVLPAEHKLSDKNVVWFEVSLENNGKVKKKFKHRLVYIKFKNYHFFLYLTLIVILSMYVHLLYTECKITRNVQGLLPSLLSRLNLALFSYLIRVSKCVD